MFGLYKLVVAILCSSNFRSSFAMAPLDDTTAANRFDSFNVFRTPYKKIGNHGIDVGILVPKDLKPGKHPLVVKFHGGGLVRMTRTC